MTTDTGSEVTIETAFHARTAALTQDFVEYNGYWLANSFDTYGPDAEYRACREGVIVTDLSPLRKFEVTGPDAEVLLQATVTRNVRRLSVGQVTYTAMCHENGGLVDEGTLARLGQDNFRWVGGNERGGLQLQEQARQHGLRAWVRASTAELCNLAVQGPKSRALLDKVVWTPPVQATLAELGWFRLSIGRIGDFDGVPIVVTRTGYTGELGYEVWCHPRNAVEVWDAIWQAGQSHDMVPLGLEALDTLRIEAGLVFAGAEYDDNTDPFEAGIGFTVALDSTTDDFAGRQALIARRARAHKSLVGLELQGNNPASPGDEVHIAGKVIGKITSSVFSPTLEKSIALAQVADKNVDASALVKVELGAQGNARVAAQIVSLPFYDPRKLRVRS